MSFLSHRSYQSCDGMYRMYFGGAFSFSQSKFSPDLELLQYALKLCLGFNITVSEADNTMPVYSWFFFCYESFLFASVRIALIISFVSDRRHARSAVLIVITTRPSSEENEEN